MTPIANAHTLGTNGPQWFEEGNCKIQDFHRVGHPGKPGLKNTRTPTPSRRTS